MWILLCMHMIAYMYVVCVYIYAYMKHPHFIIYKVDQQKPLGTTSVQTEMSNWEERKAWQSTRHIQLCASQRT